MKSWITQLRKGLLEYCILSVLRHQEGYGYEVVIRLKSIDELVVTESTVYPILSRLKRDGHLRVRSEPSPSGPPRRYFSLTSLGKQHLQSMDTYWDSLHISISNLRTNPIQKS
jgi:PadR family transcriptional regulator PadR